MLSFDSDFDELDSFESSMYASGLPRRNSENNLTSSMGPMSTAASDSSRPVDMPVMNSNFYGSDTSLNLSGELLIAN